MKKEYKICTRCIMDTSDPYIEFDENGVCNHCRKYDMRAAKELTIGEEGKQKLNLIAENIKQDGRGKEYDCVIGVSGGVDSTMVALLVKKLGLRALAVHVDNGWNSELAVSNIEKTLKKLEIDLFTEVIDWEEFKDLQLSFLKASVANIEIPTDHAITSTLLRICREKNIKYLISGSNIETEAIMPSAWGYDWRDWRHISSLQKKFGKIKLKSYPHTTVLDFLNYFLIKKIKIVRPLNLINYRKKEAIETLQREIGWISYGTKHYESIFTRFFQGYILPVKFGFDKRRAHLSTLVCSGQMKREEALEEMKRDSYPPDLLRQDKEFVIKKLGLSEEEFEKIMKLPVKTYKDYPSNYVIFSNVVNFAGIIKKIVAK